MLLWFHSYFVVTRVVPVRPCDPTAKPLLILKPWTKYSLVTSWWYIYEHNTCGVIFNLQTVTKLVWTPDLSGCARKGLGNSFAWKYLAGMSQFLNPANFIFRCSGTVLLQFSNFLRSTIYSLPVISRTRTLVG